jgi:hypothetical protein
MHVLVTQVHEWKPIEAWYLQQEQLQRLPLICKLSRRELATPASSVYSERVFSQMGIIYDKKRSKLLPSRSEHITFLHANIPKLDALAKKVNDELTPPQSASVVHIDIL